MSDEKYELPEIIRVQVLEIKNSDILIFHSSSMRDASTAAEIEALRNGIKNKTGKDIAIICVGTEDSVSVVRGEDAQF